MKEEPGHNCNGYGRDDGMVGLAIEHINTSTLSVVCYTSGVDDHEEERGMKDRTRSRVLAAEDERVELDLALEWKRFLHHSCHSLLYLSSIHHTITSQQEERRRGGCGRCVRSLLYLSHSFVHAQCASLYSSFSPSQCVCSVDSALLSLLTFNVT
jgi:hypothetical protein